MANMNPRDEFFTNVRRALGRAQGTPQVVASDETALSQDAQSVEARAQSIEEEAGANADELMSQLQEAAAQAGWKVIRAASAQEAAPIHIRPGARVGGAVHPSQHALSARSTQPRGGAVRNGN